MNKKVLTLLTASLVVVAVAACSENLEGGRSCPLLCPEQAVTLHDTTIDAVVTDTTVPGLPPIGSEGYLMLASHGDTLETRAIIRFDTLPQSYNKTSLDSTIVHIDSAILVIPIVKPDSTKRPKAPLTIEAYNVDTTEADTVTSVLATLFRPDRFLGSKTFAPESLLDTLRLPISTDSVLTRVLAGTRLRVGFRVRSSLGIDLRIGTTHVGLPVTLRVVASKDTAARPAIVSPLSNTPKDVPFLSSTLSDYTIVLKGGTSTPNTILGVGGVPSRRVFLRFDVPSRIIDSTTIVRASLLLTQTPNRRLSLHDSVFIYPLAILATPVVTDVSSLMQFAGPCPVCKLDSLSLAPGDSGVRSFEIVGLVRTWRSQPTTVSPRTLALRSGNEGQLPAEIDFFSSRAPLAVRPRLRITYVTKISSGLP